MMDIETREHIPLLMCDLPRCMFQQILPFSIDRDTPASPCILFPSLGAFQVKRKEPYVSYSSAKASELPASTTDICLSGHPRRARSSDLHRRIFRSYRFYLSIIHLVIVEDTKNIGRPFMNIYIEGSPCIACPKRALLLPPNP